MNIRKKLEEKTDSVWNAIIGEKTDEQIDLERELIEAQLEDCCALLKDPEADPTDVSAAKKFIKRQDNCIAAALREKPNRHLGKDIFSHPITGCFEHKDHETGEWVPGPALGHGSEPGYTVNNSCFGKLFEKLTGEKLVDF